ncbi:MAG TPA: hypothetical protein VM764_00470 [Gemmatimonadaceae bacterium]|nr:hypothetical protein [Gemmatimonadaceae bacterium]
MMRLMILASAVLLVACDSRPDETYDNSRFGTRTAPAVTDTGMARQNEMMNDSVRMRMRADSLRRDSLRADSLRRGVRDTLGGRIPPE